MEKQRLRPRFRLEVSVASPTKVDILQVLCIKFHPFKSLRFYAIVNVVHMTRSKRTFAVTSAILLMTSLFATPSNSFEGDSPASQMLSALRLESEVPAGYTKSKFTHWIDADKDACDTREEVLLAESKVKVKVGSRCSFGPGEWTSPYDGATTTKAGNFVVSHFVPLKEAWESGANQWDIATRTAFANDLGYSGSLVVVSASSNRLKDAKDPQNWMPKESSFHCSYVSTWIAVKYRWRLSVDTAEKKFLSTKLASCGNSAKVYVPKRIQTVFSNDLLEGSDLAANFYDPTKVHRVDLTIPPSSLLTIRQEYETRSDPPNFSYVPAKILIHLPTGNIGPLDVGVRLKGGWGSQRSIDDKSAFKVKVDFGSKKTQTILGLKKLTFNNAVQDPSYVNEALAYRVFRKTGVGAPRVGYVRLFVNCEDFLTPLPATSDPRSQCTDYGLHTNIETWDEVAISRWIKETTHLYEGGTPHFPDATSDHIDTFQNDIGNSDRSSLRSLAQINTLEGEEWFSAIKANSYFEQMVQEWATEIFVGHWDGYTWNRNNYYLHTDSAGKWRMFPWGTDQTLSWLDDPYAHQATMAGKCLAYQPCHDLYTHALIKAWSVSQDLNLRENANRIYAGLVSSSYGSSTDPWSQCRIDCAANRTNEISSFFEGRSSQISPIADSVAQSLSESKPTLNISNAKGIATLTSGWAGASKILLDHFEYQTSVDGISWQSITKTKSDLVKVSKLNPRTVKYYRVRVVTIIGNSQWSDVKQNVTPRY